MEILDVVDLRGNSYERGLALGRMRRERVSACVAAWLDSLRSKQVPDPQAHLQTFLSESAFKTSVERFTPGLLEELQGMADGSGVPLDLVFAAQLMDEEWAYRDRALGVETNRIRCSTVTARSVDGPMLIGQNMDLGGYTDGHQIVLRMNPSSGDPAILLFSISSMIGLLGVNAARIAVCVNSLPQLPSAPNGLPVAFMIRYVLMARSLDEAARRLLTTPHATGQHYVIASATGMRSFEASPTRVVEYISSGRPKCLHTNHPLAPELIPFGTNPNSLARLRNLVERLAADEIDLEMVKAALSSTDDAENPVSRVATASSPLNPLTGMVSFTTGSMISTLDDRASEISTWVSPGPPSIRAYEHLSLNVEQ